MKAGGGNASYPLITRGSLPLTTCLQGKQAYGYLASLHPDDVEPYLQKNMYYKVISQAGEIDPATIPNFHVAVKCNKVKPADSEYGLPDLSAPYQVLQKATEKLPAGKPYTYTPQPNDMPAPNADYSEGGYNTGYPENNNGGNYQSPSNGHGGSGNGNGGNGGSYGSMPWGQTGYCPVVQTIKYVYPDGRAAGY